ncbi:putative oxidoreductase YdhV [archaeon]|nr:putative oxidoreductase YdhV [archaeon]
MTKVLRVDLRTHAIDIEELDEDVEKKFIGGSNLAAKILWEETSPSTNPLGGENRLIFAVGPLTGTIVPSSSRYTVVAKSPLTGIFGEANSGGSFGFQLSRTGYIAVVIKGVAESPVYLWIDNENVEIKDATHLWGKDTYEAHEQLLGETDRRATAACIGQAGERKVLLAGIINDGKDGRAAARCGLGAVMGSKNLKAVVVRGTKPVKVADVKGLKKALEGVHKRVKKATLGLATYGTAQQVEFDEKIGDLPVKNWTKRRLKEGESYKISGQNMTKTILTGNYHCTGCPVGCGRTVKINGKVEGAGPEYESIGQLGSNCLITSLETVAIANELCNRYGIDTISTGQVIAYAMEAFERGFIDKEKVDLELTFGNDEAFLEMIRQIGEARGFGRLLGRGVMRASEEIGLYHGSMHVKGLEFPAHDPRAKNSLAVGYATGNRGADHLQSLAHDHQQPMGVPTPYLGNDVAPEQFQKEGIGIFVAQMQHIMSLYDSLVICKFLSFGDVDFREVHTWYNLITGFTTTFQEFLVTGERIFNLKRMYNIREGISRKDDNMPRRIVEELKVEDGMPMTEIPNLEAQLDEYYNFRGWDNNGVPTEEKLHELGLDFVQEGKI